MSFSSNLPPGRERRNIYGNLVSNINQFRSFRQQLNESRQQYRRERQFIIRSFNQPQIIPQINSEQDYSYENLFLLKDIVTGLKVKELFTNSKIKLAVYNSEYCSICFDEINSLDIIRELNCNHSFHINCIEKWFCSSTHCPLCRKDLHSSS